MSSHDAVTRPGPSRPDVPAAFHVGTALVAVSLVSFHFVNSDAYVAAMQEDGVVEWMTFLLFLAAGGVAIVQAVRNRRVFDLLVALFCLFVAGEEISWGQRLMGYVPPDLFLKNNFQQETNLHNFSGIFGRPKWVLAITLGAYGLLLPAAATKPMFRGLMQRIGATPPPFALIPWFATCVFLLVWYPIEYTGEWVEMIAGALFVAALAAPHLLSVLAASLPLAVGLAWISAARGPTSAEQLACAAAETAALARDAALRAADRGEVGAGGSIEKRIWSAAEAGYLDWSRLDEFRALPCAGEDPARIRARRSYGIDPWGTAYWLEAEGDGVSAILAVYSFGPNRRRDLERGDDIRAVARWDEQPTR